MNKKNFYIFPRLYNYGGIMNTLIKALPLASYYKLKPKIIHIPLNIKKRGKIFESGMENIISYKKLIYDNNNNFYGFDIFLIKIDFLIKILSKRYLIARFIIKFLFLIFFFFSNKAKKKYQEYINSQKFYSGEIDKQNFEYLKSFGIKISQDNLQEIYLNRSSFNILNENEEIEYFRKINYPELFKKSICFHLREESFNKENPLLKKNNSVIFYEKKDFRDALQKIINEEYKIYDLSKLNENLNLDNNFYIDLKKNNFNQEEYKYLISKNCEFFISTGGGISELPRLFKKPILRIDHEYNIFNNFSFSTLQDNIIFCNVYDKKLKRFISIKEQFYNLKDIFPKFKAFNYDRYKLVKNSKNEIKMLITERLFDEKKLKGLRDKQREVFDVKNFFFKKNYLEFEYKLSPFNPKNPYINWNFYEKTLNYSDYLETKTIEFNKE
jgi:putative glycosyltransferase (TIGR04372 family)